MTYVSNTAVFDWFDLIQSAKGEKTTLNTSQAEGAVEELNAEDAFGMLQAWVRDVVCVYTRQVKWRILFTICCCNYLPNLWIVLKVIAKKTHLAWLAKGLSVWYVT